MYAKDFTINYGCESQEVKDLTARLPYASIAILLLTFFIKAVDLGDLAGFVVTANKCDLVWISVHGQSDVCGRFSCSRTYFAFRHISNVKVSNEK